MISTHLRLPVSSSFRRSFHLPQRPDCNRRGGTAAAVPGSGTCRCHCSPITLPGARHQGSGQKGRRARGLRAVPGEGHGGGVEPSGEEAHDAKIHGSHGHVHFGADDAHPDVGGALADGAEEGDGDPEEEVRILLIIFCCLLLDIRINVL